MSDDIFIKRVVVNDVHHVKGVDITLGSDSIRHLILTGPNGSGKTQVLRKLNEFAGNVASHSGSHLYNSHHRDVMENNKRRLSDPGLTEAQRQGIEHSIESIRRQFLPEGAPVWIEFNDNRNAIEVLSKHQGVIAYFADSRRAQMQQVSGPSNSAIKGSSRIDTTHGSVSMFHQFLVNLEFERVHALADGDTMSHDAVAGRQGQILNVLKGLFSNSELRMVFNKRIYNYAFEVPGRPQFGFEHLSAGMSSSMSLFSELLVAANGIGVAVSDLRGVVFIDEIETHLHIELQRIILPLLISVFPRIQFIVTTHSPFVISSIGNAVVYDLKNKEQVEDMANWSINSIVKSYYDSSTISTSLASRVSELSDKVKRRQFDEAEKVKLRAEVNHLIDELNSEVNLNEPALIDLLQFLKNALSK